MAAVLGIIGSLLLLTALVVVHEWGHFSVAKKLGFRIEEFGIGFGPKIFKWVKDKVLFTVRWLPLGGFVRFYGETDDEAPNIANSEDAFNKKPVWKRCFVFASGPFMNLVLALLLTVLVLCFFGDYAPVIANTIEGGSAREAGILPEDRLVGIDGKAIDFYVEMQLDNPLNGGEGDTASLDILRNGEKITYNLPYKYNEEAKRYMIGISYMPKRVSYGVFEAIGLSFKWLYINVIAILNAIFGALFLGKGAAEMSGPVGTVIIISEVIRSGFENVLRIAAIISVNLAVINLIPLPALDGGKIFLLGIEKLRRKQLSSKVEMYLNLAGFGLLIVFMILLTFQDITRLIGSG